MNCPCRFCAKSDAPAPIANGGRYTVIHQQLDASGEDWNVIGPSHPFPHVCAAWGCPDEASAIELAAKMNEGFVPPVLDRCDGCHQDVDPDTLVSRPTDFGVQAFCPHCR